MIPAVVVETGVRTSIVHGPFVNKEAAYTWADIALRHMPFKVRELTTPIEVKEKYP